MGFITLGSYHNRIRKFFTRNGFISMDHEESLFWGYEEARMFVTLVSNNVYASQGFECNFKMHCICEEP